MKEKMQGLLSIHVPLNFDNDDEDGESRHMRRTMRKSEER